MSAKAGLNAIVVTNLATKLSVELVDQKTLIMLTDCDVLDFDFHVIVARPCHRSSVFAWWNALSLSCYAGSAKV